MLGYEKYILIRRVICQIQTPDAARRARDQINFQNGTAETNFGIPATLACSAYSAKIFLAFVRFLVVIFPQWS